MLKNRIGKVVHYVCRTDNNLLYEIPNVNPAIITQVHDRNLVDLFVLHSNGSYHLQKVHRGEQGERGTWHNPGLLGDENS